LQDIGSVGSDIDLSAQVISFECLKKGVKGIRRRVSVPAELLDAIDMVHGIQQLIAVVSIRQ
jgi:hypothetical protein